MITIRLMGGLGNQLFQLSGMVFLHSVLDRSVRCDTSWFETVGLAGDTPRAFEIDGLLGASEHYRMPAGIARCIYSPNNARSFREQGPHDDLLRRLPARWVWAEGYYQRAEYPTQVRDELSKRLLPVLDGMPPGSDRTNVIGVHVRLGDYLTSRTTKAHHGMSGAGYFREAVEKVREVVGNVPIRVFTDSPDLLASSFLDQLPRDITISGAVGSWETLRELAACSAIVMSNSSFSWWAAFIATVLRGRTIPVVMPSPWFASESAADKLMRVDGWEQIRRVITAP